MEEIGRIVPRALKQHVRRDKAPLLAVVAGLWPRVAGRAVAEQSRPVAFSGGVLTLSTGSESWAVQLRGLGGEICTVVNKALGQQLVRQLRVRLVRNQAATPCNPLLQPKTAELPPVAPGWAEVQAGVDTGPLAALDPETRKVLSHSFAKYFARAPQRIN